ncbi:MAG: GTP-binding protein [Sphaerochaetaceae bacterium]|jgi:G3E family GTPase
MIENKTAKLILITGFLGSGKTTLINNLLNHLKKEKVALILNDFGSIVIDDALVEKSEEVVSYKNLSGGQIFCSCLSGSFIESVENSLQFQPDYIIVETSGLAKPSPMLEIVSIIKKQTKNKISYNGMLCVIDAQRFEPLFKALNTIEEQIMFSDWFLINKTDLVDKRELENLTNQINKLRPLAPLYNTEWGIVEKDLYNLLFDDTKEKELTFDFDLEPFKGWGVHGRPKSCIILTPQGYKEESLEIALHKISSKMLRMKGFLPHPTINDSSLLVSGVGPNLTIKEKVKPASMEYGLVCIHAANMDGPQTVNEIWNNVSDLPITCYATE